MLEGSVRRVEVRPQVVLEVLADLEDHDALQRHGLPAPPLDAELGGIDLPDKVRVEGRRGGGRAPMLGGDAGEAVPLDVEERDGAAAGGCGDFVGRRGRSGGGGIRGERVLGRSGVPELEDAGAKDLRHGWGCGSTRFRVWGGSGGLRFGWWVGQWERE